MKKEDILLVALNKRIQEDFPECPYVAREIVFRWKGVTVEIFNRDSLETYHLFFTAYFYANAMELCPLIHKFLYPGEYNENFRYTISGN